MATEGAAAEASGPGGEPRVNRHGAARRAQRPLEASHLVGVFAGAPEKGSGGPMNFSGSERSRWVARFRERWQRELVNDRFLLQKPPRGEEPPSAWRAAAKSVRRSDRVLQHWRQQVKRQRRNHANAANGSGGDDGGGSSGGSNEGGAGGSSSGIGGSLLMQSERLNLSSDDEDGVPNERRSKPFEEADTYPSTEDESIVQDSDSDSGGSLGSPSPSLEDGISSPYIVPNHGHLPKDLSWNDFQKHFKGYPTDSVAKQWQQYQADGGRWMTGRVGGWDSDAVVSVVQPYRSDGRQPSTSSTWRKSEADGDEGGLARISGTRGTKRTGPWTPAEDALLQKLVNEYGLQEAPPKPGATADGATPADPTPSAEPAGWAQVSSRLGLRTSKQCRERWRNHLDPQLRKGAWAIEEQKIFVDAHRMLGNAWADIAKLLPGR